MRVPLSKDTVVTSLYDMENECLLVQARLALKMEDIGKKETLQILIKTRF